MKEEQIRILIAKACGWKRKPEFDWTDFSLGLATEDRAIKMWGKDAGQLIPKESLPKYCFDLNAMHEAEKVLTPEQMHEYVSVHLACAWSSDCSHHIRAATATAAQRCEAFLRTLNLWPASVLERSNGGSKQ